MTATGACSPEHKSSRPATFSAWSGWLSSVAVTQCRRPCSLMALTEPGLTHWDRLSHVAGEAPLARLPVSLPHRAAADAAWQGATEALQVSPSSAWHQMLEFKSVTVLLGPACSSHVRPAVLGNHEEMLIEGFYFHNEMINTWMYFWFWKPLETATVGTFAECCCRSPTAPPQHLVFKLLPHNSFSGARRRLENCHSDVNWAFQDVAAGSK